MKHYISKSYCSIIDLPSWEEVLQNVQNDIEENRELRRLDNLGLIAKNGHLIDKVNALRMQIHKMRPEELVCTAHLFISLTKFSQTFGRHVDTTDVYYIQALGETAWEVEENNEKHNYILRAGDMLYIPKHLYHTPTPMSPRVGISIAFH